MIVLEHASILVQAVRAHSASSRLLLPQRLNHVGLHALQLLGSELHQHFEVHRCRWRRSWHRRGHGHIWCDSEARGAIWSHAADGSGYPDCSPRALAALQRSAR